MKVTLHNLDTHETRMVGSENECLDDIELSVFLLCLEAHTTIAMGRTIAEPSQE